MRRILLVLVLSACGGAPLLNAIPQPNKVAAAGIAAAAATAATIAFPNAAGMPKEQPRPDQGQADGKREQVPLEVLDRADAERAK